MKLNILVPRCLLAAFTLAVSTAALPADVEILDSVDAYMEASGGEPDALRELIDEQRAAGAPRSRLIEAEILYAFRSGDFSRAGELASALESILDESGMEALTFFRNETGVNAFIRALSARAALNREDMAAFEKHVKEAFWLDPGLGQILADWIGQARQGEEMAAVRLPMERRIKQSNGETTTLAKLMEGKKAVLLDFWASWCGPCVSLMPELMAKADKLEPQGVVVAGMNTEDVETAERFRKQRDIDIRWLVEPDDAVFSQMLAIDSIPRMILVSPEGEVLFNGHPMDAGLKDALAEVGATL